MKNYVLSLFGIGALAVVAATVAVADVRPPTEAMPLSKIAVMLEKDGYTIGEAEFERRGWEFEVVKDGKGFELKVDALSGKVISTSRESGVKIPPAGSKPLSEIAASVEKSGYVISEAEFERNVWDIDAFKDAQAFDITVDPKNGEILTEKED